MHARRRHLLTLLKAFDLVVVVASILLAAVATSPEFDRNHWLSIFQVRLSVANVVGVALYLAAWHVALTTRGLYNSYRLSRPMREVTDLAFVTMLCVVPLAALRPLVDIDVLTPGFVYAFAVAAFVGLCLERRLLREIARRARTMGRNLRDVVFVGAGRQNLESAADLARRDALGYHVVEVVDIERDLAEPALAPRRVVDKLQGIVDRHPIDEVFVALDLDGGSQSVIREIISTCEEQGVTVRVIANLAVLEWAWASVDTLSGHPVITIASGPPESVGLVVKRVIDIVISAVALVVFAPIMALVALAIRLDSSGPAIFRQERVGLNRRRFPALKFRTMVVDAEKLLPELERANEASGAVFKIRRDPRITRVGRILRRTSLDELPQLWNVFTGDMSIVGPRPLPVRDVDRIEARWHHRRFAVKPGITCLWQVTSRRPNFDDIIRADMEYIDNWSLALDFKIMLMTVPAVLSGEGAH
ncbi:sugar transferase [bacterium]|nr:sugar transferase [bacterium]